MTAPAARSLLAAMIVFVGSTAVACREKEQPVPETVADVADGELAKQHHAIDVFTLVQPDGTYRVLVFKLPKINDADSDYRLVVYRKHGNVAVRHGDIVTLVGFGRPRLSSGPPPRIETTERRFGVRFHVGIDEKGTEMVPSETGLDGGALIAHPPER